MNILKFHRGLIENYKTYIQSFVNIKDKKISDFVEKEISDKKLWPEPLVQFNPNFEKGRLLSELVNEANLHSTLPKIFEGFELFKHQEEAILLGTQDREFIVTSGTGSGKSLTYIATIFNHVLHNPNSFSGKIQAVIVYPMNALINSQYKEIEKYKDKFEEKYGKDTFPITFAQYTGQENNEEREALRAKPPHIILTNYMMLELIMTRGGEDVALRKNILENLKYLVFDELHTYRGRQGSDVSVLIRRIKSAAANDIISIGTSATMVSGENTSLAEQKKQVANVASTIFGSDIDATQVINERLVKSIGKSYVPTNLELQKAVHSKITGIESVKEFENHATANWIEQNIALELKEDILVRRKPVTLTYIAEKLAVISGTELQTTKEHLEELLNWANLLNANTPKNQKYLPFRIHQFIAQTGSVYSTLGDQESRELFLDAGLYADNKDTLIYPMVFSRTSGHEFNCITLNTKEQKIEARETYDTSENENDEDEFVSTEGYLFINHKEDEEPVWDLERDKLNFPDTWFTPERKDGSRSVKKEKESRLPRKIYFDKQGNFSFSNPLEFTGWFITYPLMFDPTSGLIFDTKTSEWSKVMKLGGEGRSTATTVMSFETITQLHKFEESPETQKLLSFTDNRQDASLQAGHFNDFVKVGQLRAAITKAVENSTGLDFSNIATHVFDQLELKQEQYAKYTATFPGPKKDNEDALKDLIMYRIIHDLRRSWRVVLPNLEQCGLLRIEYKHLSESVADDSLWTAQPLLLAMPAAERYEFLHQVFDFFRKTNALNNTQLEPNVIRQKSTNIREKLKEPWTLDKDEKIDFPNHIRFEKLGRVSKDMYTESGGSQSVLGRFIKEVAKSYEVDIRGRQPFIDFIYPFLNLLCDGGWLTKEPVRNANNDTVFVYRLRVDTILWKKGDVETMVSDKIKARSYREIQQKPNEYFRQFYKTDFKAIKQIEGKEHTGQINSEERKRREKLFRSGEISTLFCSPTMELGIDIADLSIVHMRNVPPTPANYAQRSGRAGRSGQAALVLVYCSNFSAHDRHYFKNNTEMVAGTVTAPRIDLINEELLLSHLHASILTVKPLHALKKSMKDIVDIQDTNKLALKQEIIDLLELSVAEKQYIVANFSKVINDRYFNRELEKRKPGWFTEAWIKMHVDRFTESFDASINRWRKLYRAAQEQIKSAASIIENRIYGDNHEKKIEARRTLFRAEIERDLLLNDPTKKQNSGNNEQSEFYPYRYLAAEGFLPGYNFTRLPIRSFMETEAGGGEYISRPRFVALQEFGPRNVIYHDGAKYRIDKLILTDAELKLERAKVCPKTGYFLYDQQYGYEVDPIINEPLQLDSTKHIHSTLIEMTESRAHEQQRITCQEEERTKKGYDIQTYFSVDGGFENSLEGLVKIGDEKLLHIHYFPTCRIYKLNLKWRASENQGFSIQMNSGNWKSKAQQQAATDPEEIKDVKLFTSDTANAIYIQPVKTLALQGGNKGVITLMFAIKKAIENHFQVESNEMAATIMGEEDAPNILIYESSEGSLGVLSQLFDSPAVYKSIMQEAYKVCFIKNGVEEEGEVIPATYDDLLSYYNQYYHKKIDRNLVRDALQLLRNSNLEITTNKAFDNYEDHYQFMQAARDPNSSTEEKFLKHLFNQSLRLPDEAQPHILNMYVRPDFLYKPNICIFCDGTPHDKDIVREDDTEKRSALMAAGYQVLSWHYLDSLDEFVAKRPDIFKKVR
jgi:superfamily II DNA/RNA helicase/very-short-patch-repair endonuclease